MGNAIDTLADETLHPRHFSALKLTGRQLHVWCDLTGFQPQSRSSGKWRRFSPLDVLRLGTLKELKQRTGLSFSSNSGLLDFIGEATFPRQAISMWENGVHPVLVTDLDQQHRLNEKENTGIGKLMETGSIWCLFSMEFPIFVMLRAVVQGGSDTQVKAIGELAARNYLFAKSRRKHTRAIDLGESFGPEKTVEFIDAWFDQ